MTEHQDTGALAFGQYIKDLRIKKGLRQKELGDLVYISVTGISLIENGKHQRLTPELVGALIDALRDESPSNNAKEQSATNVIHDIIEYEELVRSALCMQKQAKAGAVFDSFSNRLRAEYNAVLNKIEEEKEKYLIKYDEEYTELTVDIKTMMEDYDIPREHILNELNLKHHYLYDVIIDGKDNSPFYIKLVDNTWIAEKQKNIITIKDKISII